MMTETYQEYYTPDETKPANDSAYNETNQTTTALPAIVATAAAVFTVYRIFIPLRIIKTGTAYLAARSKICQKAENT